MRKLVVALVVAVIPHLAWSSCTYSTAGGSSTTVATCTLTTEAAPTLVTEGRSLAGLASLSVVVESSGTLTAGGTLAAYVWVDGASSGNGFWIRAPDLDLTAQALTKQTWPAFTVTNQAGRIDFRPAGTGAATTTIHLIGANR